MLTKVAVIVLPGLSLFEFGVVCEVFGLDRSGLGVGLPAFDFRICTPHPGAIRTDAGVTLAVDAGLEGVEDADLVVMTPFPAGSAVPAEVLDALRAADARGARVFSVCSGAFALAEAGLLDGRCATTHWRYTRRLADTYPGTRVDENVLYVEDGNVLTSAGTAAGIDASLHLIRQEFGPKAATAIARSMVVPPHRDGGQAQFIERPIPQECGASMEELLIWLADHLDQDISVAMLARRLHMSERTFARRFRAETGTTPAAWLTGQRLLRAQSLLEETRLTIDAVARASGFSQAVLLRHHFQKALGVSPAAYRRTFRGSEKGCDLDLHDLEEQFGGQRAGTGAISRR
ncbi:helix-turn-helix domain-containing protein [Arthrobacter sp. B1805]|uniref:helix-turn-helix domain-containing protein n=1 Tax=Arthrobacter sp. B1805 TaxID=2058892 RepID=UPI000CE3B81E|nr:helix-turn-helix domain-containing protein [Arthrobacter sp. B1805]